MINKETIERLSELSRLDLTSDEKEKIAKDLESILAYVAELQAAPKNENPNVDESHINIFRDDDEFFPAGEFTEKILIEAPRRDGDFILVKQVLEEKGKRV